MESWPKKVIWLTATAFSCLFNVHQTSAAPAPVTTWTPENQSLNNASLSSADFGVFTNKIRDNSIPLRILGLGASIMAGWGSPSYNGCVGRKPLRDALRQDGWDVDMVGSLKCGNMVDNDCEAVAGDVLTQILARVPHSLGYKPNIVIINGGTNDANGPAPGSASVSTAGNRMNDILNALWGADGMSNTCIMLSTLIPTNNANGMVNVPVINNQYRALVTQRAAEGKCIYLAEMWPNGDSAPWLLFDTHYLATESPHDKGHSMMASVFYNSILSAISDNRIVVPGEMVLGSTVCDKVAGTGVDAGGLTQRGSGYDDGIYYHNSAEQGVVLTLTNNYDRGDYKWARLFNRNYDDLLIWNNHSATSQVYAVFANSADGKGTFKQTASAMDGDLNCEYPEGVNFIDMNGDGLDDLVYIDADGNAYLSINQGDGDRGAGKPPTFKRVSSTAKIMDTNGYDRPFVVLADIDGDGRGDFGRIDYDGNVKFWRNGGTGDSPSYWQALGQRWASKNYAGSDLNGNFEGTRFEDVNGDGRDDMVWLDQDGSGHVWTNSRSCGKGLEGDGLKVAWREGFYQGGTSKAYAGMGAYVTKTETNLRHRIHFARIYGEVNIFGNLPRQDYVFMEHSTIGSYHQFKIRVWKNTGGGGTKLKGDGNKYCNMMGHSNGMVDYVWTYSFGTMEMWANRGKGKISDSDPDGYWDYQGTIWTPPNNINRKDLHLSDWDGDGACNIIYVNPDNGAVKVWLNRYPKEGNFDSWNSIEYLPSTMSCSEKRGLGFSDLAVRFADITGNGRADYLCISPDTTVKGYIHNSDGSFTYHDQIKLSIGKDRANLRWADVNGDGREDMLWIEKFSGDTFVYYNEGPKDPSQAAGSSFGWYVFWAIAYAGQVAGSCEYFADLNGDGFADEHYLSDGTSNNKAMTSLSPGCVGTWGRLISPFPANFHNRIISYSTSKTVQSVLVLTSSPST
ncbi:family 3 carbohydrate esterase [Cadophora sp. MPI-SDFR-AT-0126]|nr:family 3 carbohydrate esterase [Leotiomycetes sp. MPI-SDFR-AT-0126]